MNRFAHHASSAAAAIGEEEFALVQHRYVAAPALMWAVAMLAVLMLTALPPLHEQVARPALAGEVCECLVQGA